jgi:uncharacterized protein (TIGR03437 family)
VVNGASYAPVLTPGGLATIFGYGLASTSTSATSLPLTNVLGGTQVTVGGMLAPLLYVSPSQINFQVPWELAGESQAVIAVTTPFGASSTGAAALTVNLSAIAPAIFGANGSGNGQGDVITPQGQLAGAATPATRGQYVLIYCSGLGAVSSQPATGSAAFDASSTTFRTPSVTIGGVQASTNFAGLAPGYVGVYQVNALVPGTITPGPAVPLTLSIDGVPSNKVMIGVQ